MDFDFIVIVESTDIVMALFHALTVVTCLEKDRNAMITDLWLLLD